MGLIYVDEDGVAHDDEGNTSRTRGLAPGHYKSRDLPRGALVPSAPKYRVEDTPERRDLTNRLILAAVASGDTRSALFLIDTYLKYALSDKQLRYRAAIESRLRSLASKMPNVNFVDILGKHIHHLKVERLSDTDRRRLEPFFLVETGLDGRSELQSYRLNPDLRRGPTPLQQAQADAIRRLFERTKNYFLQTTLYGLEDGTTPTSRQMEIVRKIFVENGEPVPDILKE